MPKELHVLASAVVIVAVLLAVAGFSDAGTAASQTAAQSDLQQRVASDQSASNR